MAYAIIKTDDKGKEIDRAELPDTWEFERVGITMTGEWDAFPAQIVADLAQHGLPQKVGDKASGATSEVWIAEDSANRDAKAWKAFKAKADWATKNITAIREHAQAIMESVVAQLASGEWGATRAGGYSALDKEIFGLKQIVDKLTEAHGDDYTEAKAAEKRELAAELVHKLDRKTLDALTTLAQQSLDDKAEARRKREERDKAAAEIVIDVKL